MSNSPSSATESERLLRLPSVEGLTGLSRSGIYAGVKAGTFPAPVKLSARAVAWNSSAVSTWIASRRPSIK
jgi:prophage regulatory protein